MTASRSEDADLAELPPKAKAHTGESESCGVVLPCGHQGSHPHASCHAGMVDAIKSGDLSTLVSLDEAGHGPAAEYTLIAAAEHGQVACVEYLRYHLIWRDDKSGKRKATWGPPPFGVDARQGVSGVCDHFAKQGNLMALQTLVKGGCSQWIDRRTLFAAANGGCTDCTRYLGRISEYSLINTVSMAVARGSLEAFKLLFCVWKEEYGVKSNGLTHPYWSHHLLEAAQNGYLNHIEFAVAHGAPWCGEITEGAAKHGHADILRLAVSQGERLSDHVVIAAIAGRNMECLQIALDSYGGHGLEEVMVFAAALGFLEEVRYLHGRGCALWGKGGPIDAEGLRLMHKDMPYRMRFGLRRDLDELPRVVKLEQERRFSQRVFPRGFDIAKELQGGTFVCPDGDWHAVAAASLPRDTRASKKGRRRRSGARDLGTEKWGPDYRAILRYGACKGEPLTQRGAELLKQQRECTRTVLRGFARAGRQTAKGVGLPNDVVHSILLMAGLEIDESFGYTPQDCT